MVETVGISVNIAVTIETNQGQHPHKSYLGCRGQGYNKQN